MPELLFNILYAALVIKANTLQKKKTGEQSGLERYIPNGLFDKFFGWYVTAFIVGILISL